MTDWYAREARLTVEVSERMLELAGIRSGMRVLDLATGRGEPLVRIAHRVGPTGLVVGVDPWMDALEETRRRVGENVQFQAVSADAFEFVPGSFEAVTSRWGLFSMPDPVAVLRRARQALKPGGCLVAALWAEYERIPWYSVPREVAARFGQLPPLAYDRPGPLRLATLELIERDFGAAGWVLEHVEERECAIVEAEDLGEWVRFFFPSWVTPAEELQRAAEPYRKDGVLRLGGVTRLVVAR
ncbi:MAG: class I SAM-dependent methyltransferase [Candidatus Eremiobacteraeota bacterium]|nr:class I SAM-dependent methyltransferase [Candidatus Eremiobacteraeota bacterium]